MTTWLVSLPNVSAYDRRTGTPNQRVETNRCEASRLLGVDEVGRGLGVGLAALTAAVAHPCRSAKVSVSHE